MTKLFSDSFKCSFNHKQLAPEDERYNSTDPFVVAGMIDEHGPGSSKPIAYSEDEYQMFQNHLVNYLEIHRDSCPLTKKNTADKSADKGADKGVDKNADKGADKDADKASDKGADKDADNGSENPGDSSTNDGADNPEDTGADNATGNDVVEGTRKNTESNVPCRTCNIPLDHFDNFDDKNRFR